MSVARWLPLAPLALALTALVACGHTRSNESCACACDRAGEQGAPLSTLTGIARDARGGAMIADSEAGDLLVEGLEGWPPTWNGQRVVVSGRIVEREGPSCVHDPEPCQGTVGTYRVLTDVTYHLE